MGLSWARFLSELEESHNEEAVLQLECKGAFLTFRSKIVNVERPAACSPETVKLFGVVPNHVTLTFSNGTRLNLYMKHIEELSRCGDGVVVSFRGEGSHRNTLSFFPPGQRRTRCTG